MAVPQCSWDRGWGKNSCSGSCGSTRGTVVRLKIQPELSSIMARITVSYSFTAGRGWSRQQQGCTESSTPVPRAPGSPASSSLCWPSSQRWEQPEEAVRGGDTGSSVLTVPGLSCQHVLPFPPSRTPCHSPAALPCLASSAAWLQPEPSEGSAADSVAVCASTSRVSLIMAPLGFSFPACLSELLVFATLSRILQGVFTDVISVPLTLQ